jgi:hypothetical protein
VVGRGENTRAEVREIFARHAAAREGAGSGTPHVERRATLPGALRLPAVVLAVLVALLLPPAPERHR